MELTLFAQLAAILFFALLVVGGAVLARGPSDLVLLFLLVFALFAGFRPLLFVLGLDGPYPDFLFPPAGAPLALTKTLLALSLYLLLALVGIAVVTSSGVKGWGPFFAKYDVDIKRSFTVTYVLTGLAAVLSAYLVARYGGIGGVIGAAKVEKSLAGMYVLRTIPAVGAIMGVATFIEARARSEVSRAFVLLPLACALANGFFVFLWGARSVLIVVGAMLILGLRSKRPGKRAGRQRVIARLLVAVVLVVVAASGMRMVRDTLVRGEVEDSFASASVWRQVSVGTNSIYFDAAMLSFRDWPSSYQLRDGEDFYNGVVGVVPRFIWKGKPAAITPGQWFRQVYDPRKVNGWPMGAPALWYLNFGWWGLPLGGLLSGLAIGLVAAAQRRRPQHGFNTGIAVVTAIYVLPLGWDNQVLMKFVVWLVPLWLVGAYVAPRRARASAPGERTTQAPPTPVGIGRRDRPGDRAPAGR
jgi:oligosaccharide repeat unit polymerase